MAKPRALVTTIAHHSFKISRIFELKLSEREVTSQSNNKYENLLLFFI